MLENEVKTESYEERSAREIVQENEKSNLLGNILIFIGLIVAVVCLLATLFYSSIYWTGIIYGLLVAGVGEIIWLLRKIYLNMKK